jgi:hypothetical protein
VGICERAVSPVAGARKTARLSREGRPTSLTKSQECASHRWQAGQGKKKLGRTKQIPFQLLPGTFTEACPQRPSATAFALSLA